MPLGYHVYKSPVVTLSHLFPNLTVHIIFYGDLGNFSKYKSLLSSPPPPEYGLRGLRKELFCYVYFLKDPKVILMISWFENHCDK